LSARRYRNWVSASNNDLRTAEHRNTTHLNTGRESSAYQIRAAHITVDCGNGVAGDFAAKLYRGIGCTVTEMFCEVDGNFPTTIPTRPTRTTSRT
jgi:phosphomannomutase